MRITGLEAVKNYGMAAVVEPEHDYRQFAATFGSSFGLGNRLLIAGMQPQDVTEIEQRLGAAATDLACFLPRYLRPHPDKPLQYVHIDCTLLIEQAKYQRPLVNPDSVYEVLMVDGLARHATQGAMARHSDVGLGASE